jgi:predicted permease
VWVPYGAASLHDADRVREHQRMVGRLAPGATLEAAREQAAAACAATGAIQRGDQRYTAVVFPGLSDGLGVTRGRLMRIYWTATAGAAVLFLLACANAAHLLMSRNIGRRRDLALKAAIGASRARVCRGLLVEAALVAMLAAGVGFMACLAMTSAFRSDRLLTYLPTLEGLAVDWRVGLYTTALAAITVLLAAGLPSLLASRADPQRGLSEFARGASRGGRRLREGFVAVQVALSIALVASAGVLAQTLIHLETKDLGFDQGVLVAPLRPRVLGYDAASITQFHHEVEDRLSAAPGIEAAAFGWASHLAYQNTVEVEALDRRALPQPGHAFYVSSEYLTTLNAPLVAGRMFTRAEARADNAPVVVVDESLATAMFGSEPAAGRYLRLTTFDTPVLHEVIGVVRDTGWRDFREGPRPALYLPAGQSLPIATMHVRSRLPSAEAAALIRRIVREVEPALPVDTVTTLGEEVRQIAAEERLLAKLGLVLAALALGMAAAGIHAAVACGVGEQKREFGIRMALGASRGAVGRGVLGRVLLATSAGMLAGLALYVWASRFIEARLYEISRLDAATLGAAMAILTSAALLAAWLPTRRATRVDPTIALRAE